MKINSKMLSLCALFLLLYLSAAVPAFASYINPAGMTATATSSQGGLFVPGNLLNTSGLIETSPGSGIFTFTNNIYYLNSAMWTSGYNYNARGNDTNPIVQFDLGGNYTVDSFHVWNYNEAGFVSRGFAATSVSYSTNGTTWRTIPQLFVFKKAPGTDDYRGEDYAISFPIRAHYIRFLADSNYGGDVTGLGKVRFNDSGRLALPPRPYKLSVPEDSGIINVKQPPYNAKGDGIADDTAALQKAINDWQGSGRSIYLPNGIYSLSNTLAFPAFSTSSGHNNIIGQSRAGTVLRLKDNTFTSATTPQAVLDIANTSAAQWFDNNVSDLTISTGSGNAGAIGLKFFGNNISAVRNVSILSGDRQGVIGLDLGYANENGPLLIKNVKVYGFDTGIKTGSSYLNRYGTDQLVDSMAFEHITLQNQNVLGFQNNRQCLSIRDLVTIGSVPAFHSYFGVITLIDSTLQGTGNAANLPAAINGETLFARNVRAPGFQMAIMGTDGAASAAGTAITEFVSTVSASGTPTQAPSLFPSPATSMNLTIKETPNAPLDDPNTWANVRNYRQVADTDDTAAIEAAIASGATTIYFPKGAPYVITHTVNIEKNVRRIVGMFSDFTVATPIAFRVTGGAYPILSIEDTNELANLIVQNSTSRALVLKNASATYRYAPVAGVTVGNVFAENVVGSNWVVGNQKLWARQLNIENQGTHLLNNGGAVWILGYKTERSGTLIDTEAGGKTEVLGGLCYTTTPTRINGVDVPMFIINNASASLTIGEVQFSYDFTVYLNVVQETRGSDTRILGFQGTGGTQTAPRRQSIPNAWNGTVLPLYTGYTTAIAQEPVYRYAPDGGANVYRYDGNTGAFVDTFASYTAGDNPMLAGVAFGPDNNLYASAYGLNRILRFDGRNGAYTDTFAVNSNYAVQLLFDADGSLYTDSYRRFSPIGKAARLAYGGPVAFDSGFLYQASDNMLLQYFADFTNADDVRYGTWFRGILAANGYIYLAEQSDSVVGRILRCDATNFQIDPGFGIVGVSNPTCMAIAPNGNLVVSTDAGVKEFDPFSGAYLRNLPGAGGWFVYH